MIYRTFGREVASVLLRAGVVISTVVFLFAFAGAWFEQETISDGSCNIAVLPIEGVILPFSGFADYELVTTPSMVRDFLAETEQDEFIKGVLLEVNSPGGTPVAAEQISQYISASELPIISSIGDIGASGAYLVAASSDRIIASPMSDVGSIGVTMSYLEASEKNTEEGLTFVELSSGVFKDAGNPDKAISEAERAKFQSNIDIIHDEFVKQIAHYRDVPIEKIEALADGSSMPGVSALEAGLVDELGGRSEVKSAFADILGTDASEIVFCEYSSGFILI